MILNIRVSRLIVLMSLLAAPRVSAVELTQATNQQILDELSRRLGGGAGPYPTPSAAASYTCDYNANLNLTLSGSSTTSTLMVSDSDKTSCLNQANLLTTHRSRVSMVSLIGVCDYNANLHRISLNPSGQATEIGLTTMSSKTQCLDAASRMNSSMTI